MSDYASGQLTYTTVLNLHDDLIFSGSSSSLDAFSDSEENIYNQICDILDDGGKISEYIPSPPNQLMLLIHESEKPEADLDKIHQIVKRDLGLLSEVVRISNSPMYRTRTGEINSIERAISILGIRAVTEIASQLLLRRVVDVKSPRFRNFSQFLWRHCLNSAEAGSAIGNRENAFTNYLLGLIHAIGRVVVLACYVDIVGQKNDQDISDVKLIKHVCLEQGPWLSLQVAKEWDLPEVYLETLDELDKLSSALLLNSSFDIRLDSTKTLFLGSSCEQIYVLIANQKIDRDAGYAYLNQIGLDNERTAALFERFDKLGQALS